MSEVITIQKDELYTAYQPLYHLENESLFSFESLLRSKKEIPPNILFDTARTESKVNLLDRISIKKGISGFTGQKDVLLFLNVFPSTLIQEDFFEFLDENIEQFEVNKNQLVFELNETVREAGHWSIPALKTVVNELKKQGVKIAIDDVGTGIACNQKIIEFEPDFVKLDKYFGIGLSQSKLKQMTVQSYQFLCKGISQLVLEGIETLEDLQLAKELGVHIGQGFYLGKPDSLKQ